MAHLLRAFNIVNHSPATEISHLSVTDSSGCRSKREAAKVMKVGLSLTKVKQRADFQQTQLMSETGKA